MRKFVMSKSEYDLFQERIKSLDNNFKEQENTLEEIVIKNFNEEYIKIDLYDSNDNFIGKLDRNQYIDVRIQAYMKNIKGLYVVYPDGEKGFIEKISNKTWDSKRKY